MGRQEQEPEQTPAYQQLAFEEVALEPVPEVILENCIVVERPTYTKIGQIHEWRCGLSAPPDLFHQERDELVEAHATHYAQEANRKRLRPGDRVVLKGLLSQQELSLENGETRMVNYLRVSDILVIERAERKSITVFEQKRGR